MKTIRKHIANLVTFALMSFFLVGMPLTQNIVSKAPLQPQFQTIDCEWTGDCC